jgi:hypothetical protein
MCDRDGQLDGRDAAIGDGFALGRLHIRFAFQGGGRRRRDTVEVDGDEARLAFTLDGAVLRAIDIDVTGSYGTQLRELGDDIRRTVLDTVRLILDDLDDSGATPAGPIDVTITDVVDGDPLG